MTEPIIIIIAIAAALLAMFALPFLPGLIELLRPRDDKPLYINVNYSKDPEYFGRSFKVFLEKAMADITVSPPGVYDVTLSKPEKVRISDGESIGSDERIDTILYIRGDLDCAENLHLDKEAFIAGRTCIGPGSYLKALYSEGAITIGRDTKIVRWLDSEKDIEIEEGCTLGMSAATSGTLTLGRNCRFTRLYGLPVRTYTTGDHALPSEPSIDITEFVFTVGTKQTVIPPGMIFSKDLIVKNSLVIRQDCVIQGSVKVYGDIIIEDQVTVNGDLFSEGDIRIGHHSTIIGNVFSQGHIELGTDVRISEEGAVKSVISKKGLSIGANSVIYGYLMTDVEGIIA